jgi:dienelactone hydrolase
MAQFRRAIRWFFALIGLLAGLLIGAALFVARYMIAPPRQRLWTTPGRVGLDFEDVNFPATDGLRVSGWFLPAGPDSPSDSLPVAEVSKPRGLAVAETQRRAPTIVLVHSWTWNRLGYAASGLLANLTGATPVDLLRLAKALHDEGYNVLTFDQRNHGQSTASRPFTFGQSEAKDFLGAVTYLMGRPDVDPARIGAVGFSMGANALLFALPQSNDIRAAIMVQPATPGVFARGLTGDLLGVAGPAVLNLADRIYQLAGGARLSGILPGFAAAGAGRVPVLFVQGSGDHWGDRDDFAQIARNTPCAQELLFVDSHHRFGGYQYLVNSPQVASRFFAQHMR